VIVPPLAWISFFFAALPLGWFIPDVPSDFFRFLFLFFGFLSVLVIIRMCVVGDRPAFCVYGSWDYGENPECIIARREEKIKIGEGSYFSVGQDKVHFSNLIVALLQLTLLSLLVIFSPVSPIWSLFFLLAMGPGPSVLIVVINTFLESVVVEFWVARRGVFGRVLYTAIANIAVCLFFLTLVHNILDVRFDFFLSLPQWAELFGPLFLFFLARLLVFGFPGEGVIYARFR